jgi:acyl-coenzyme A thioesterase 9
MSSATPYVLRHCTVLDAHGQPQLPSGKRLTRAREAADTRPRDLSHLRKSIAQSTVRMDLPFGRDANLRDVYSNAWGRLRIGLLLEELDAFAGLVAYTHCDDGDARADPPTLVTASLDRLDMLDANCLSGLDDLSLRGAVTFTGKSSMNIDVDLVGPCETPVMLASTTFVSRGRGDLAAPVPVLVPSGPAEERLHAAGALAMETRKRQRMNSLQNVPPSGEELKLVHGLYTELINAAYTDSGGEQRFRRPGSIFAHATGMTTSEITMPTATNVHGKIFGGFLLRKAFELAFSVGWRMTGSSPRFVSLEDVSFLAPVEVGTLLRLDAHCDYSHRGGEGRPSTYSVTVAASMQLPGMARGPSLADTEVTNEFHFTFAAEAAEAVPRVFFSSYADSIAYVGAHRRAVATQALAEAREASGKLIRPRFE